MSNLENYGLTNRFKNEATLYKGLKLARVIAEHRGIYKIITEDGIKLAEISGKLRYETDELAKFPTVGDFVMVAYDDNISNAIIHNVLSRKSIFLRTAVGVKNQAQPVAANIDTVFICMSLNNNYNLNRLERYLAISWDSGATPVILLTKSDLCDNLEQIIAEVERVSAYSDVITTSMFDNDILDKIAKYITNGTTSAFIGSSGVGKSTLINKLIGSEVLETASIGSGDKGRHTTTGREMFPLLNGGVVIDTPGVRELGVETADISKTFEDIELLAQKCKFSDCLHENEPSCAVRQAILDGELAKRRFESYKKLKIEAGYDGLDFKQIENKKLERMFKDVGGMKNVRKFIKEQKNNR